MEARSAIDKEASNKAPRTLRGDLSSRGSLPIGRNCPVRPITSQILRHRSSPQCTPPAVIHYSDLACRMTLLLVDEYNGINMW